MKYCSHWESVLLSLFSWKTHFECGGMESFPQLQYHPAQVSTSTPHQHNILHPSRNSGSIPGTGCSPGVRNGLPLQYSCLEKCHGQRTLVSYNPWGYKESDTTEHALNTRVFPGGKESACQCRRHRRLGFHPLVWKRKWQEEEMGTHSIILVWEIPWTEDLGRLQSMWPQRTEHN